MLIKIIILGRKRRAHNGGERESGMALVENSEQTKSFMKSLGFPDIRIHHSINHFDFTKKDRRIIIIGPMGSGKSEFSARIYRDSQVALKKSRTVGDMTTDSDADRRVVFYVRSTIDKKRFKDYPEDALAYRGGYEVLGKYTASIDDSFGLEEIVDANPCVGTWIVDEAEFFDERIAYVVRRCAEKRPLNFVFPMLILNFRKDLFNRTARLLMEGSTDVFPLTAYCEHPDCIRDSYYTYRYYLVDGVECPALYFDPLIIVGGDTYTANPKFPNYATRCDAHHYLPAKDYTFLVLKPLGEIAFGGNMKPLKRELRYMNESIEKSELYAHVRETASEQEEMNGPGTGSVLMNSLKVDCIAEKALLYLFCEENLLALQQLNGLAEELGCDRVYMNERLYENRKMHIDP